MRTFVIALALAMTSAAPAFAHPDHDMFEAESPRDVAMGSATDVVARMIERRAIPESWRNIHASSANTRQRNGATEWVVVFENPAIANPTQRRLYVMLTEGGVYLAANYSGE